MTFNCELNCFCRCDGSCRAAAPVHVHIHGYDAMSPATQTAVLNMAEVAAGQVRKLYPDNVPDFTREACEQAKVNVT